MMGLSPRTWPSDIAAMLRYCEVRLTLRVLYLYVLAGFFNIVSKHPIHWVGLFSGLLGVGWAVAISVEPWPLGNVYSRLLYVMPWFPWFYYVLVVSIIQLISSCYGASHADHPLLERWHSILHKVITFLAFSQWSYVSFVYFLPPNSGAAFLIYAILSFFLVVEFLRSGSK